MTTQLIFNKISHKEEEKTWTKAEIVLGWWQIKKTPPAKVTQRWMLIQAPKYSTRRCPADKMQLDCLKGADLLKIVVSNLICDSTTPPSYECSSVHKNLTRYLQEI